MTSSFGLTYNRNQIINSALRTLGKLGKTQTAGATDLANCSEALNLMIKSWINKGATLWKIQELLLPMVANQQTYPIGPTAAFLSTAGITLTAGGTGGTTGTYSLGITDSTGSGAAGTYTIAGGAVTTITITAGGSSYSLNPTLSFPSGSVTGAAATIIPVGLTTDRPLRFIDLGHFMRNNANNNDSVMIQLARIDYEIMGQKGPPGAVPSQFYWNPQLGNGILSPFPVFSGIGSFTMHLFGQVTLGDTTNPTDLFDFPQEFLNALKWGLCNEVMTEYGVDDKTERRVMRMYEMYVQEAFNFSTEEPSAYFTMDLMGTGRGRN